MQQAFQVIQCTKFTATEQATIMVACLSSHTRGSFHVVAIASHNVFDSIDINGLNLPTMPCDRRGFEKRI
jgi:hypothetical protein